MFCRFFKYVSFAFASFCVLSCSNMITPTLPSEDNPDLLSQSNYNVSLKDIETYLENYKGLPPTKSGDVSISPILSSVDTVLYLINYNKGWEILSADRRAPRVFAMSSDGHLDLDSLYAIPPVEALISAFTDRISYLKQHPNLEVSTDFKDSWDDILGGGRFVDEWTLISSYILDEGDSIQPHLTQTRWGQNSPWNVRAPYTDSTLTTHCLTGCVPVAGAQMLYYLHNMLGIPSMMYADSYTAAYIPQNANYLILSASDVSFSNYSSSAWNSLPLTNNDSGNFSTVSTLMVQLGLLIQAQYRVNSTGSYTYYLKPAFQNAFTIESTWLNGVDFTIIADEIMQDQMPVILELYLSDYSAGHCAIVDACKEQYQIIRRLFRRRVDAPVNPGGPNLPQYEYKMEDDYEVQNRYFGLNWGWNGSGMYSGNDVMWFSESAMSWTAENYTFSYFSCMIYDFREFSNNN